MLARDLAALLATTSRKVAKALEQEGIHPLRGDTDASPPMLIYRRTEQLSAYLLEVCDWKVPKIPTNTTASAI